MKILLVEDDATIASGIEYSLQQEGFVVSKAASVKEAYELMEGVDLYLLDLTLPDGTGYDICRRVKEQSDKPVIFLSACDEEVNVVMGLDMGGDDYITKPFRVRELMSRIHMVLRRYGNSQNNAVGNESNNGIIKAGNVTVSVNDARVYKNGKDVELTALEYRLLLTMLQNRGQVLSRNQLLSGIWDIAGDYVNDNTLTVYVKRLRDKLEDDPAQPCIIETVRGMGYRIGRDV
ncbi:MAG: response regulator transcription factor [Lachnospiraceae bacterium]|nr:response regulator transcription factor [Lachnospiraceae bacterium]